MDSVAVEMNISRFYERLAAPDPDDRPHLALLNAMFLTVSKLSPLEHVRAQEEELFIKSEKLFKSALRDMVVVTNNTVDLVQCAVLMSVWLWGQCREAEAFFMTSTACRLSLFGGFEQISDSNNVKGPGESLLVQARGSFCPPMRDAVELADRIYTFWAVIMLDLTGSIATGIPPNIDITTIRTPLPRPWVEYGMEPQTEDSYLIDLFTPKYCSGPGNQNEWPHFVRATALLQLSIAKVTDSRQGTPWHDLEQMPPNTPSSFVLGSSKSSSARDGFRRTPCLDLEGAVERFAAELPPKFKSLGSINSSHQNSLVIMMQTTLACIRMYLADTNDYTSPNDAALYQARKIVDMAKFVESGAPLIPNLCLYVMWIKTIKLLTREVKRLQHIGEVLAATSLESDADTLLKSLESAAEHSPLVASTLKTTLQSVRAATLPVQQETPIPVADSLGRTADSEYNSPLQGKNGTPCL
ncbi:hypothetical protein B9479_005822 [Cryptococcus floricola]|uniref:Xylanolytic transcriptional activator regulatory domain-containing protein n=1 Tax=Cryptococcus floricola TaxID=2591691 RepID=A0A5D3ATQ7_9TREE|nr:hypothetical protein B9479_005822 [Cryptococcus floricola]